MDTDGVIDVHQLPDLAERSRTPLWWAMIFLVLIEATVFGTLIAAYFYLRVGEPQWPPAGIKPPDLLLPTLNTGILLASSVSMVWADKSVGRGNMRALLLGLWVSIVLALVFLALKVVEYSTLDYQWDTYAYGSIVWTISGFHGAHVTALILKTIIVAVQSRFGNFRQGRVLVVQVNGIYWHFVVVAWIPLYIVLYLVPRVL